MPEELGGLEKSARGHHRSLFPTPPEGKEKLKPPTTIAASRLRDRGRDLRQESRGNPQKSSGVRCRSKYMAASNMPSKTASASQGEPVA